MNIFTYPSWDKVSKEQISDSLAIVIDIFRASNSIISMLENGFQYIYPKAKVDEALSFKEQNPDFLLAGERNSLKIRTFDFGNSPLEFKKTEKHKPNIIFTSSNGTKALLASELAEKSYIASFRNQQAILNLIKKENKENILIICAGTSKKTSLEDSIFAGSLIYHLGQENSLRTDFSYLALASYLAFRKSKIDIMKESSNAKRLFELKLEKDFFYCLEENKTNIIPSYCKNKKRIQ